MLCVCELRPTSPVMLYVSLIPSKLPLKLRALTPLILRYAAGYHDAVGSHGLISYKDCVSIGVLAVAARGYVGGCITCCTDSTGVSSVPERNVGELHLHRHSNRQRKVREHTGGTRARI